MLMRQNQRYGDITTTTAGLTIPQRELSCLAHCGKCTRWPVTANNSTLAQSQNVRSILNYTTQLESSNICARSWHAKQLTPYGYKYDENYESKTTANLDWVRPGKRNGPKAGRTYGCMSYEFGMEPYWPRSCGAGPRYGARTHFSF